MNFINKVFLFLFCFTGLIYNCFSQSEISAKLMKINQLDEVGSIEESIIETKELLKIIPINSQPVINYNIAKKYALIQKLDSSFYYLNKLIYLDSTLSILNEPDFFYLLTDQRWDLVENVLLNNYQSKNEKILKPDIAKALFRMKIRDQAFYYHIGVLEKLFLDAQLIPRAIWDYKLSLNDKNLLVLGNIVDSIGWPKKSEVTNEGSDAAFIVIQHNEDIKIQKKYLPMIYNSALNGESKMSNYAYLEDRINILEGKLQNYGTQVKNNDKGVATIFNLFEPQYVNQRRKQMGLNPIEEYAKSFGILWEIKQLEK